MSEPKQVSRTLAGVEDAIVVYGNPPFCEVEVKELTKGQILRLASEWEFITINATPFYYSRGNLERLLELCQEGKLIRRDCEGTAFELPKAKQEESRKEAKSEARQIG